MEMLVQSTLSNGLQATVQLLPALPQAWVKEGQVQGVRIRGGYELDLAWKDGQLTRLIVHDLRPSATKHTGRLTLRHGKKQWQVKTKPGQQKAVIGRL